MNACSRRGHYFWPVRQYGQLYSFRREVERAEWEQHMYHWDREGVLGDVLQLSRLILDHGWSNEFAARVIEHDDGQQQIVPPYQGFPVHRVRPTRDWLTATETDDLRALLAQYWQVRDGLPGRVTQAMWKAEFMCRVQWLDIRVPLLVIAFEGLISTSHSLVRRQFRERAPRVADAVGAQGITAELCDRLYRARSRWAHGAHIALTPSTPQPTVETDARGEAEETGAAELTGEITLFQHALRQTVRRCIEDPELARVFSDGNQVRNRWPVVV
jgi:hypothetical protein